MDGRCPAGVDGWRTLRRVVDGKLRGCVRHGVWKSARGHSTQPQKRAADRGRIRSPRWTAIAKGFVMTFRAGKTQSMAPDRRRSGLVVGLRRADTGEVTMLDTKPRKWVIGADPSCDVPVGDDPFVSACHCVIERRENGVVLVRDRNSRNGTFVDGAAIEGAELMIGSYLSVGRTTFVAVAGAGSATVPAVELIVGQDPVLRRALDMAVKAAASDCSVLILGETGTGKDLFARMIHERSRRANARFVPVNCGGIPRELIASELFGHEKGAFTGATEARDGFFLEASGGTLFLDEIGELPLDLQSHLLRALENRTVRRVGGTVEKVVNARIVAATNRTEGLGTDAGRLRADLYHRIATIVIVLPPLRERMGDLALLVNAQLDELAPTHGHKMILPEAWAALQRHSWPGNVRELRAAVRRAVMMGGEELG
ncbi:MAG: sigma 54-interacting transcriptional regulator, partial [Deltaproteobacteria bacterium]|nr:sigma 54-interacting transcriptional regulator [Deltaproteobacteria bacterium]